MSSEKETKNPRPFTQNELLLVAKLKKSGAKVEAVWNGLECSFKTSGGAIRGVAGGDCGFTVTG
jgi:hypothetical protein